MSDCRWNFFGLCDECKDNPYFCGAYVDVCDGPKIVVGGTITDDYGTHALGEWIDFETDYAGDMETCQRVHATSKYRWSLGALRKTSGIAPDYKLGATLPVNFNYYYAQCFGFAERSASKNPNAVTNYSGTQVGTVDWVNPMNARTQDNVYATVDLTSQNRSKWLMFFNFQLAVPDGATIEGIEVEFGGYGSDAYIRRYGIQLYVNGVLTGENKGSSAVLEDTPSVYKYGGPKDLWGLTLTDEDVNRSNFGFGLELYMDPREGEVAYIDYGKITVHYSTYATTIFYNKDIESWSFINSFPMYGNTLTCTEDKMTFNLTIRDPSETLPAPITFAHLDLDLADPYESPCQCRTGMGLRQGPVTLQYSVPEEGLTGTTVLEWSEDIQYVGNIPGWSGAVSSPIVGKNVVITPNNVYFLGWQVGGSGAQRLQLADTIDATSTTPYTKKYNVLTSGYKKGDLVFTSADPAIPADTICCLPCPMPHVLDFKVESLPSETELFSGSTLGITQHEIPGIASLGGLLRNVFNHWSTVGGVEQDQWMGSEREYFDTYYCYYRCAPFEGGGGRDVAAVPSNQLVFRVNRTERTRVPGGEWSDWGPGSNSPFNTTQVSSETHCDPFEAIYIFNLFGNIPGKPQGDNRLRVTASAQQQQQEPQQRMLSTPPSSQPKDCNCGSELQRAQKWLQTLTPEHLEDLGLVGKVSAKRLIDIWRSHNI